MSVDIDPPEQLEFNRPFTQQVARYLKVRNPTDTPIAYKVKTTAPRSYCVRPNSGRIEPGEEVEVQVLLQAMKVDVPADMKCKDKFLLQSTPINDASPDANLGDLWAHIEKEVADGNLAKESIQQKKIRCVWGPPLDANGAPEHPPADMNSTPTKANGVSSEINTPLPPASITNNPITSNNPIFSTPVAAPVQPQTQAQHSSAPSAPSVEAQLAEAKAQIVALTKQLEVTGGSGLRQRSTNTATPARPPSASAREMLTSATENGVPVKIVAYLCLAAFLLAYLFF